MSEPDGNSGWVPLDQVKPGAVLRADLADSGGMTLLAAGTLLTESLIASLNRRGITQVPLAPPAHTLSEEEWKEAVADLRRRVTYLFRLSGEGEAVDRLRETIFGYRLGKLHTPWSPSQEDKQ